MSRKQGECECALEAREVECARELMAKMSSVSSGGVKMSAVERVNKALKLEKDAGRVLAELEKAKGEARSAAELEEIRDVLRELDEAISKFEDWRITFAIIQNVPHGMK